MSSTQLQSLTAVDSPRDGSRHSDEAQSIAHGTRQSVSHYRASRWAILLAAFGITFIAVGVPNSFGVFQEYYKSTLFPDMPSPEIIIIGSLSSSLYMVLGVFTGRFADILGYQAALISGSILIVGGLVAASFSTQFYQLVLSQGLAFGLGTALVYYPAISVSGQYFRRHGLANGFVVSGGALGGCIGPYSVRIMIQRLGLPGTFRMLAYISAGVLTFSCVSFMRAGRQPGPRFQKIMDLRLLKDPRFLVILVSGTVAMTGFLPRYFLVPASAVSQGINTEYAAWLLGLMNGLSIIGRLGVGSFADRYGKLTALIASFVLCGVGHLVFWLPAVMVEAEDEKPVALMTVFVIFVGFLGSGFVSLIPVVMSDMFGFEDLASKVGLLNSIMGLGVFAGPSAVYAIVSDGRDFSMAVLFSGLLMVVGGLMLTRTYRHL
ncbi:MFS general substrate transporter [Eremomyces bilateralis CBS 781.70]|uniref:MFS general substrate transporter n=1 Tax=Eremomyces bilateralis CBS 781.70 TaxID=1392243 RepID=A0A6G1FVV8_9PEZI|nr:MFS general substrate transporter [Eremomyces bilateralis CBS 781.70]KAF1809822.1 MFS general substrate transporter [Eremomyces bilateralis CBS 781.70]